jgi:hypothetical protein
MIRLGLLVCVCLLGANGCGTLLDVERTTAGYKDVAITHDPDASWTLSSGHQTKNFSSLEISDQMRATVHQDRVATELRCDECECDEDSCTCRGCHGYVSP